jgi:hypothetical protein
MRQFPRHKLSLTFAIGLALAIAFPAASHRAAAQSANPGISLQDLGGLNVSGTTWNFSGDFPVSAGAWESVTITNYGYCFVGPNDPRAGTAHAAGVFYYTDLSVEPGRDGYTFKGMFKPGRGGNVMGTVNIVMSQTTGMSHVDISLSGSDLQYYQDNTFEVCLLGSS